MENIENIENIEDSAQKKLSRSEEREQAFMILFLRSFDGDEPLSDKFEDCEELFEGGVCGYSMAVVSGIDDKLDELDAVITKYLKKGWSISRISKVSLAILRLAIYEIKYISSVPESVSINEAVELAKKYTIDESKFINGVLGAYVRDKQEADK